MKQCAQCAQEIHESATMCESCRRAALERLFEEASLNARAGSIAPDTAKPIALPTAGTTSEPAVTKSGDTSVVPVVEHQVPALGTIHPASPADDALRPATIDELRLTPSGPATDTAPTKDVSLPRVDAAVDEWNIPGLTTVRREPPASSLSVTAPMPAPSVTREPEIVPAATRSETLPISGERTTTGLATYGAQSVEGVPHVVEQSAQQSTPAVPAPPAISVPLAVLQAPAVPYPPAMSQPLVISETATAPGGESFDIPEQSTFSADRWLAGLEQTPVIEPAAPLTIAPIGGLDVTEPLVTEQTTVPGAVEALTPLPIESLQVSDPLPSAPPAAPPSPQMLVGEPPAVVSPSLEPLPDEDPAPPEADEHQLAPALASEQEAVPLAPPPAAAKPKKKLGAREFALIAMTLLFGGTVTFAMLRASVNRQPAAPAAAPQVAARAPKPAARSKSAPAKAAGAHTWTSANRDWVGNQKRAAAFEVLSNNKVAIWTRKAQPILVVRCMAKRTDAFVFIESAAQLESQPNRTVRIRFDDEPESNERWPDSDAHDALFAPDGAAFTQRLLNAHTLHFGYRPHNSPEAVAEFNVSGLGAMLAPVAKECGQKK